MLKKRYQLFLVGVFIFLFVLQSPQRGTAAEPPFTAATITVTAGSDALVAGTPIVIDSSEFSGNFSLATAVVSVDNTTGLATQYDADLGEFVFQLPSAVAASGTATFFVNATETGTTNDQTAMETDQGDYNTTFAANLPSWVVTAQSIAANTSMVDAIGDVLWIKADWGTLCLALEADWRQGTFKHVVMENPNWDAVGASFNSSSDWQWQWAASLFQDADEGWPRGGGAPDTVKFVTAGPVRTTIQVVANSDWKDNLGQSVQNVNATRTYTIYNDLAGITQHFTLTGANATQAQTNFTTLNAFGEPLGMKHQLMDGRFGEKGANNLTKVLAPGDMTYDRGSANLNLSKMTDSYLAMYHATEKRGYVYNFGTLDSNLKQVDAGNEIVMNYAYTAFPAAGLMRYYTPFNTYTGAIADKAAALNTQWVATYTVAIVEHERPQPAPAPGFEFILVTLTIIGASLFVRKKR
ncbi:MAG: hypothetical protein ACXAC8_02685 [Candidatus Hodarchaeales archaeon]|jgi:hypothetical protein